MGEGLGIRLGLELGLGIRLGARHKAKGLGIGIGLGRGHYNLYIVLHEVVMRYISQGISCTVLHARGPQLVVCAYEISKSDESCVR